MQKVVIAEKEVAPSKVVCIGRNYVEHIQELNNEMPSEPVIFVKPNSAISRQLLSGGDIAIHYEAEITFLIENDLIIGAGIGLDLTKRSVQSKLKEKGLPWERAKAFDNSALFSDFVTYQGDGQDLHLELWIDGKLTQQADYELMINKPLEIINEVSRFMSFSDHDLLMTGTPKGVGVVNQGAKFVGKLFAGEQLLIEHTWLAT